MQYPTIISTQMNDSQHEAQLQLHIPASLIYFEGHFPDFPILPGVAQLNWAIYYAKKLFELPSTVQPRTTDFTTSRSIHVLQIEQIKFTKAILPNDNIELQLALKPSLLLFKYLKSGNPCSLGKIKLESTHD